MNHELSPTRSTHSCFSLVRGAEGRKSESPSLRCEDLAQLSTSSVLLVQLCATSHQNGSSLGGMVVRLYLRSGNSFNRSHSRLRASPSALPSAIQVTSFRRASGRLDKVLIILIWDSSAAARAVRTSLMAGMNREVRLSSLQAASSAPMVGCCAPTSSQSIRPSVNSRPYR